LTTPVVTALSTETASIPVVFALSMDPVGLGHVKSLSRPGGNFTGFTYVDPEMIGKWMGLLGDMVPQLTRIGLLYNPTTVGAYRTFVPQVQANHRPDNLELVAMPVRRAGEMEAAINALATRQGGGLLVGPDPFNQIHLKHIAKLTTQSRLPAVSVYRSFVMEGGLMMYGPDTADIFRRSAEYVDRILKGANPAELPVQQPSKYECIINLKTAKLLGLTVPPTPDHR
jgi:putative ABC transport system substrate-binding protein